MSPNLIKSNGSGKYFKFWEWVWLKKNGGKKTKLFINNKYQSALLITPK